MTKHEQWRLGIHNPFTVYRVADGAHDVDHAREGTDD